MAYITHTVFLFVCCKQTHHGVHGEVVVLRLKVHSVLVADADLSVALQEQFFIVTDPVEHLKRERENRCIMQNLSHTLHTTPAAPTAPLSFYRNMRTESEVELTPQHHFYLLILICHIVIA